MGFWPTLPDLEVEGGVLPGVGPENTGEEQVRHPEYRLFPVAMLLSHWGTLLSPRLCEHALVVPFVSSLAALPIARGNGGTPHV
jgi:hypothetical protein